MALVTLSRPDRLNAMTFRMFDEFLLLGEELGRDESVRAVLLTGSGRGFCSGLDLDEAARLPGMTALEFTAQQERCSRAVAAFRELPQPVIAAVNGAAAGGGLALALAADIRIASPDARFNAAFVRIGLSAGDVGASWALPRVVGLGRASELMLTGRFVDAREALAIGLVTYVSEEGRLLEDAYDLAGQIAANSPLGVRLTKRVLQSNMEQSSLFAALELENRGQVLATRSPDMAEALEAFREKRPARFGGG